MKPSVRETESVTPEGLHERLVRCETTLCECRALAFACRWSDPHLQEIVHELRQDLWRVKDLAGRASAHTDDALAHHAILATSTMGLLGVERSIERLEPRLRWARRRRADATLLSA